MADLSTIELVDAELAVTADYDVAYDVDKAKRRAAALRRKLDFAQSSSRGDQSRADNQVVIQQQLQQVLDWLKANSPQSSAQRLANPSVTHADFGNFRGYA